MITQDVSASMSCKQEKTPGTGDDVCTSETTDPILQRLRNLLTLVEESKTYGNVKGKIQSCNMGPYLRTACTTLAPVIVILSSGSHLTLNNMCECMAVWPSGQDTCLEIWPGLLEAWLALTSVKYHGNLLALMPLNQWLALTGLRATSPRSSQVQGTF